MTGTRDSIYTREPLSEKEVEYIRERMRTEERPDPQELARELGVRPLQVSRLISALRYIEKMANQTPREDGENT